MIIKSNYTGILPLWARVEWSRGVKRPTTLLQDVDRLMQNRPVVGSAVKVNLAGSVEIVKPVCKKTWCGCNNQIN